VNRWSLEAGSAAHYISADFYDRVYRGYIHDVPFYVELALEHGDPVLELGCGTGRVALELARAGCHVTGVDSMETMLAAARAKAAGEPDEVERRTRFFRQDIRELDVDGKFRLVTSPFNVLQHLYEREDLERCLAGVRRHLMPRAGLFAFDVLVPDAAALCRPPGKRYRLGKAWHPAGRKRYLYRESFDYDPVTQVQTITMHFDDPDDPSGSFATPLCHRQLYPAELEALLHYNGFRVVERYGGFDRSPLDDSSEIQIYLCALRRGGCL